MRLLAIIDRERRHLLICRGDALLHYEQDLLRAFSQFRHLNADMETYFALVLTPRPPRRGRVNAVECIRNRHDRLRDGRGLHARKKGFGFSAQ
jgi:hypothetical protein